MTRALHHQTTIHLFLSRSRSGRRTRYGAFARYVAIRALFLVLVRARLAPQARLLTFVVVGGGATSCEFASELSDFVSHDISKW